MRRLIALLFAITFTAPALAAPERRLTFDFHRADLHNVIRLLAEAGRMNVIIADDVQGEVSIKLRDVRWQEALDAVLSVHQLGYERRGNILRVAKLEVLRTDAELRAKISRAKEDAAPLKTHLIQVNYARASELLPHVKALLSPRGTASVDARTNVIIVHDIETFDARRIADR